MNEPTPEISADAMAFLARTSSIFAKIIERARQMQPEPAESYLTAVRESYEAIGAGESKNIKAAAAGMARYFSEYVAEHYRH